jgi:tRNA C32,U32 (ribose-2'-O)-methylase TrmJ
MSDLVTVRRGPDLRHLPASVVSPAAPAVLLVNPKYPHNVGTIVRACSCYGIEQLWMTGSRVPLEGDASYRLPREERMKGYADVAIHRYDRPFDLLPPTAVPVAVELLPNCESLPSFEHPENAVYVFGPEDGGLTSPILRHCQRFVAIPSRHCLNIAAAVYTVLYDRQVKRQPSITLSEALAESRGTAKGRRAG